ncbi:hypothetical protein LZ31DRAFT_219583 [Colletotrichum somersetense]|nr:hypothetical protein LZ31DRAFT_219583 [Colletotrichum somersetense]
MVGKDGRNGQGGEVRGRERESVCGLPACLPACTDGYLRSVVLTPERGGEISAVISAFFPFPMREILSSQSVTASPIIRRQREVLTWSAKSGRVGEEGSGGRGGGTETWEHRGGAKKFNEVQTLQTVWQARWGCWRGAAHSTGHCSARLCKLTRWQEVNCSLVRVDF